MKVRAAHLLAFVLLGAACLNATQPASTTPPSKATPGAKMLAYVSDGQAFGRGNNTSFILDPKGVAYFAVRSFDAGSHENDSVYATQGAWNQARTLTRVTLGDQNGVDVSTASQGAASLATVGDGSMHLVWTGGATTDPTSPEIAHQLRYARVATDPSLALGEEAQPFTVTGYDMAYGAPYASGDLWQEHPSSVMTADGALHVAWEARDANHLSNGKPAPGIAYAERAANGTWSIQGLISQPPYLDLVTAPDGQFAPIILPVSNTSFDLVCEGLIGGVRQVLVGGLDKGEFSNWSVLSPSMTDQRHVAAVRDGQGNLHVAWREQTSTPASVIMYTMRDNSTGKWSRTEAVSSTTRYASTPVLSTDDTTVRVVWIEWDIGVLNSFHQFNNGFPNDEGAVEGALMTTSQAIGGTQFGTPFALVSDGIQSYPVFAQGVAGSNAPPVLLWLSGSAANCPSDGACVKVQARVVP